jgi:hypothetical protein
MAERLTPPEDITPSFVPPDFNWIENYWHYERNHYWSNRA